MTIPFSRLKDFLTPSSTRSLGDSLAALLAGSGDVNSLLDCLCSTSEPAIYHPDHPRSPLRHNDLRSFITKFSLPCSRGKGLGPNDRVMLAFPTGPENAVALLALVSYHTCVPVNASCTASELRDDARRLNVKAVLTTKDAEHHLELRRLYTEQGCDIIYIEPRTSGPPGLFDFSLFDNLPAIPRSLPSQLHGLADQSLVLHTSGTSGTKKAVPYRLMSLIVGAFAIIQSWDLQPTDVNLNMMPLFHVGGIVRNLLAPMLSGGSVVMCAGFDPIAFWSLAAQLKATWYYAAPTIHHAIIASWPDSTISLREIHIRMICNGAGELVPSLASRMKEIFTGAVILPSYGMTECMPITTPPTNYQLDRSRSSGVVCGPHLSIRDPADIDRPLPSEKTGAICVRGIPTFEGYEVSPDKAVPLDRSGFSKEGWFSTGDVGHMDVDGYLYITGRSKEIINKGGEVISPSEVEDAIMTTAGDVVTSTLAFVIEHDVLQECIGVVITPMPAKPRIGLSQLQDRLSGHLHPSKWPFAIVYMDDLPKNSTGKLLRINLASRLSIGCLSDAVPARFRHFEATTPSVLASLKDPIPCSRVSIDLHDIECILAKIPSVKDVALRFSHQESIESFLSVDPGCGLRSEDVKTSVSSVLPGYSIPDVLHILEGVPLVRNGDLVDFGALEHQVTDKHASGMTKLELLVRDIFATLLPIDPMWCNRDSDFFLLGGNSLLLGQLSYHIRKQAAVNVAVTTLFSSTTVKEIALLIEEEQNLSYPASATSFGKASFDTFTGYDQYDQGIEGASRDQTHPLNLLVQAVPLAFAPLQAALFWSLFLVMLSLISGSVYKTIWNHLGALLATLVIAKLCVAILCPLAAIALKWIIIGKYKKGVYRMWSVYYLRWWIVDQALRCADKGIFAADPFLEILYYRMLGAKIGNHVAIDPHAVLGEFDLLNLQDGCRIDVSQVRGFCVERNGFFSLDYINIGRNAVINTYTVISPGANIPEGAVYGPHASSHNEPSPSSYAVYNRTLISEPNWLLKFFVAYPIITVVWVISYLPWFAVLVLMMSQPPAHVPKVQKLGSIILYFASPRRVGLHMFSVAVRAVLKPSLRLFTGILVNRLLRLGAAHAPPNSQRRLLRRFINSFLLSQEALSPVFKILGSHYEDVSMIYRLMGAKIGKRIYWPGTPVYCNEPELLTIGDDVVFGAGQELLTVDQIGSGEIIVGDGAMIADRVVLLPGTTVGRHTVMGTGALGKRDTTYEDGSVWIGSVNDEAVCLSKGYRTAEDAKQPTITPFGRAFYERGANFFVTPYIGVLMTNVTVVTLSALYWAVSPVIMIQMLKFLLTHHLGRLDLSRLDWYSFGILYAIIAMGFMVIMNILAFAAMLFSILTKWMLIGQRSVGQYDWDKSSYNQRWQVHRTLDILLISGYGAGGAVAPLSGSVYIVWYLRALGAKIGKNCFIYAGHKPGRICEPDLIEFGDNVNLDDCAVVSHINSRGNFTLNFLKIGNGCAMRAGSRLLSGASMEDNSMLCEHTLLTSGEVGESNTVYVGWPAAPVKNFERGPGLPHAQLDA